MADRGMTLTAIAATMLLALAVSTPAGGSARGTEGSSTGLTELERIKRALKEAEAGRPLTDPWDDNLRDAVNEKGDFIERGFAGIEFFGCPAPQLIEDLERIDVNLARADRIDKPSLVRDALGSALRGAHALDDRVSDCAVIEELPEPKLTRQILAKTRHLYRELDHSRLTNDELRRGAEKIHDLKLRLLAGETVNGCEAKGIFELIDQLDVALELARVVYTNFELSSFPETREARREARRDARRLVKQAFGIADGLTRIWSVCGTPPR